MTDPAQIRSRFQKPFVQERSPVHSTAAPITVSGDPAFAAARGKPSGRLGIVDRSAAL